MTLWSLAWGMLSAPPPDPSDPVVRARRALAEAIDTRDLINVVMPHPVPAPEGSALGGLAEDLARI